MRNEIEEREYEKSFGKWLHKLDYIESCIDKIYNYFKTYGYTWSNNELPPTRKEIEYSVYNLIESAYEHEYSSSGRLNISYNKKEDLLLISIEL